MRGNIRGRCVCCVALRKESVDRNQFIVADFTLFFPVALRKESVDRNGTLSTRIIGFLGRSPQGERG